ncbi:8146_t:CDS:2, partial [Gigaspora margarita]
AEPCEEEVDKDGKSLNLLCKKPGHLYRIDSNRCFAHPERFPATREYRPKGRDDLVFRKAPFPYDWFNTLEKMDATSLPPIEAFDSILNKSKCSEKAYKIVQEVWESFNMKIFRDYHDFYLNLDVLLLADCKFGLDIAHYVSLPSFAEDALYKTTGQEIELFTDDNMYLFCEKGIRGGITMVSNRQVKANNPQCPDFNPNTEEAIKKLYTWLLYVDANALYTGAMMQAIPTGGHRWITPEETPDLFNKISKCEISNDADKGYILEVDIDYPYKLYKAHTSYPLAPENIKISKKEMSKCEQEIINDLRHYTKTKKLVPNLNNKK